MGARDRERIDDIQAADANHFNGAGGLASNGSIGDRDVRGSGVWRDGHALGPAGEDDPADRGLLLVVYDGDPIRGRIKYQSDGLVSGDFHHSGSAVNGNARGSG